MRAERLRIRVWWFCIFVFWQPQCVEYFFIAVCKRCVSAVVLWFGCVVVHRDVNTRGQLVNRWIASQ
jgi:hypothetical protein